MRRRLLALLLLPVAMLLSVALAVPANAADSSLFKNSPDPKFKYGLDYWKFMTSGGASPNGLPQSPWPSSAPTNFPVNGSVNPSKTGGSWYLSQYQNGAQGGTRAIESSNKPLTGKIIEPGKTLVRAPSTLVRTAPFLGELGLGRILGMAGLGIGGTSQPPSNSRDIKIAKGIAASCVDNMTGCAAGDVQKMFNIDNCGNLTGADSCDSIGAKAGDGTTPLSQWFKDDALPFLKDLWSKLTGQSDGTDENAQPNGHFNVSSRGCIIGVDKINWGGNGVAGGTSLRPQVQLRMVKLQPKPPAGSVQESYYNWDCGGTVWPNIQNAQNVWIDSLCINSTTGKTTDSTGATYGKSLQVGGAANGNTFDSSNTAIVDLCTSTASKLMMVQFRYTYNQSQVDGSPSEYSSFEYSQWWNPDPSQADLDTTESETITTTATCKTPDGQKFTVTRTVKKTAAFAAPNCPQNSILDSYDIAANNGPTTTKLEAGNTAPGAEAKYPLCLGGQGCTMQVNLDGTPCTASRPECSNWPQVAGNTPSRVDCRWGTYSMPVSDCYGLSNAYKSESGVVFDPNSGVWTGVDAYGNPAQANAQPWSSVNPNPVAGSAPGTAPATGTGTGTFPTTGTTPDNGCDKPSWSWNPSDWVHSPVVCALKDAFVPKTDTAARQKEITDIVTTKQPFVFMGPVMTGPGGGGCPNWVVHVGGFAENVVCDSTFTAAVTGARGPMFGLVSGVMVWPLIRSLWYASIPFLRATPSK